MAEHPSEFYAVLAEETRLRRPTSTREGSPAEQIARGGDPRGRMPTRVTAAASASVVTPGAKET